ncbi:phosphohydrolase [Candidatus Shapirobacteria bacterium]|nr:phosphohydrolase [Candidatus Shapirobacteria bacterium]
MTREEALKFLSEKIENKNIIKHMIACEAMMRSLALKLKTQNSNLKTGENFDEDEWATAGLLHDGDYCEGVPPERQGIQVTEWLRERGFEIPENVAQAMAAHNSDNTGVAPQSKMDWSLFCGDSLTGLIVAATLVLPSRKLTDLTVESVIKRYREPSFARGTRREDIALCQEKLGLSLEEFVKISLKAMQGISQDLGL